jgi:hypothetical protein
MQHLHAVVLAEGVDHRRRAGRAADDGALEGGEAQVVGLHVAQQHLPHRRHAGRVGDLLGLDQLVHRLAVQRRAGEHQLAAGERRRIRDAPGVDVEHRHHRQHGVARRQAPSRPAAPRRRHAGWSSGGCRARPSGCRWCRSCSTCSRPSSRRTTARRSRWAGRRSSLRSTRFGMPVSAGSLSGRTAARTALMPGHLAWMACTSGRKVRSKHSTWSSAWLAIQAICSGCRRGLMVCSTRPEPLTPKYSSRWR